MIAYKDLYDDAIEEYIEQQSTIAAESSCTAMNLGANSGNIANDLDQTNRRKRLYSNYCYCFMKSFKMYHLSKIIDL